MQLHQNNPCSWPKIFLTYPVDKQRVRDEFMINIKDHNQAELFDNWPQLGPKRRKLLEESWAGLFQKILLPVLPVQKIAIYFNSGIGRPTKELTSSMGVLLFQQIFDLTDEETIEHLAFNIQWHYALNLPEESDSFKYISPKTLWTLRDLLVKHSIDTDIFEVIRDKIIEVFSVDTSKQRIDSVHIKSNMRKLGRIRLIANTIAKFIKNLQRHHKELAAELSEELVKKYKPSKERQPFAMVKPSDSSKTLLDICKDLVYLQELYHTENAVIEMYSYKLMQRVSDDQCIVTELDLETDVAVKPPKDIPSDSLQNPSDPDASYDGNKGQGYQLQLQETYNTEDKGKTVNVITHVDVEPAHKSDAKALLPAIKR
ncbi:MAG: transposase, partial [Desulfocapsa sp.]|nr:transposase [Desulfocapsa sp.]